MIRKTLSNVRRLQFIAAAAEDLAVKEKSAARHRNDFVAWGLGTVEEADRQSNRTMRMNRARRTARRRQFHKSNPLQGLGRSRREVNYTPRRQSIRERFAEEQIREYNTPPAPVAAIDPADQYEWESERYDYPTVEVHYCPCPHCRGHVG